VSLAGDPRPRRNASSQPPLIGNHFTKSARFHTVWTHFGHPLAGVSAAAASIQNDSGLSKDSFGTLWQAERAADRLLRGSTLLAAAFRQGLQELGWTAGHNLRIEWRWSGGDVGRIRAHAAEIAELAPELVVANGTANLSAVRQAIRSIPIVFVVVNDPVGQGFISSLAHPGGNITGFTFVEYSMLGKWLEMLKLVAPAVTRVALMFNPDTVPYDRFLSSFEAETRKYPVTVTSAHVRSEAEVEAVIAGLAAAPGGGLIVPPDAYTLVRRGLIVQAVARHRIPAIYSYRQFVKEGGLMSYAPDTADVFRRSAWYVDRILNGAKPAELPAQAPIKFEFVINLKTATTLGLTVPPTVHALTDEVIE
jgi:putative tryptophan/tyrosine transport system substrate-binding protein